MGGPELPPQSTQTPRHPEVEEGPARFRGRRRLQLRSMGRGVGDAGSPSTRSSFLGCQKPESKDLVFAFCSRSHALRYKSRPRFDRR